MEELIEQVEVVDVVTPTVNHYECASKALRMSRHVFIEKPLANTLQESKDLIRLAKEADMKVQIGHVERFNPAFKAASPYLHQPMFIETHRLAQFNPRGTDVSVVLDLMIHDIDIVLSVVRSSVKKISTSGVAVVSDIPDIANARIEFDNGCVVNLTASRISLKNMRKNKHSSNGMLISPLIFLKKSTEVVRLKEVEGDPDPLAVLLEMGDGKPVKQIYFENPGVEDSNAIREELRSFAEAIVEDKTPKVSIDDGYAALNVAYQVIDKLKLLPSIVS